MQDFIFETIIAKVKQYDNKAEDIIRKAYHYACSVHGNQLRKSGELYIIHPLEVALILANMNVDRDTVCAGILHDVVEDGDHITLENIESEFNKEIAILVDGVTKMKLDLFSDKEAQNNANTRKIIMGLKKDVRSIIIKLADRLHNMRTLQYLPKNKQIQNALETLEIFVPLANYLGLHQIKNELEDLAFQYLNPDVYQFIYEKRQRIVMENRQLLEDMIHFIKTCLSNECIDSTISYRIKSVYAIYQRLFNYSIKPAELMDLNFRDIYFSERLEEQIHDVRSLKILVSNLNECYASRDVIKSYFSIVAGKEKDCIQNPKTNGYQSLHTTIYGLDGLPVQTKIRTFQMEEFALYGLATYWKIFGQQASFQMQDKIKKDYPFYKSLIELDHIFVSDKEFVHQAKEEVLSNMIYPHTKDGKVIELPFGATPVDFAFQTFNGLGEVGMMALVNGKYVPLNYQLSSKDTVEIVPTFEHYWMGSLASYALTTCAKKKIRSKEMKA